MLKGKKIDFVGKTKMAFGLSAALIIISIISFIIQGGLNYNIEFNGGYLVQVAFKDQVKIGDLRTVFNKYPEFKNVQLQEFSDDNLDGKGSEIIIKIETMKQDVSNLESSVRKVLDENYGTGSYMVRQKSSIGPKIGNELKKAALNAVIFALIGILVYITLKFQFKYGIAAIIALFHDVFITLGVLTLLGLFMNIEISLSVIAALMTIVGYSLNDTIVVFDRIRENLNNTDDPNFKHLVNESINATFSRTLLTSLTTLFVVLMLFLFGGEVIRDLSTTLLIGVIIGTYSSIFIASPVIILWNQKFHVKKS